MPPPATNACHICRDLFHKVLLSMYLLAAEQVMKGRMGLILGNCAPLISEGPVEKRGCLVPRSFLPSPASWRSRQIRLDTGGCFAA